MSGVLSATLAAAGASGVLASSIPNASGVGAAGIQLNLDGTYTITGQSSGNWVTPAQAAVAAQYQVKCQVTGGSLDTNTSGGAFVDLSSDQAFSKSSVGTATLTITIREKATGVVRKTYTGVTVTVS